MELISQLSNHVPEVLLTSSSSYLAQLDPNAPVLSKREPAKEHNNRMGKNICVEQSSGGKPQIRDKPVAGESGSASAYVLWHFHQV